MARKHKSNSEPFTIIPRRTILSKELNSLSKSSFKIYIVMCSKWLRTKPDDVIICTYPELLKLGISSQTVSNSLSELVKAKFIEIVNHGGLEKNPNTYKLNKNWLLLKDSFENQS